MNERKPDTLRRHARRLYAEGRSIAAVAKTLGVAYSAAHKWLTMTEAEEAQIDAVWLLAVSKPWRKAA